MHKRSLIVLQDIRAQHAFYSDPARAQPHPATSMQHAENQAVLAGGGLRHKTSQNCMHIFTLVQDVCNLGTADLLA